MLESMGFDLILVEWSGNPGCAVLKLYVDVLHPDESSNVTLDDCASISYQIGAVLDVEDLIDMSYRLEVSSPGFERPLVRPEHFLRFAGKTAQLRLKKKAPGVRRRFTGKILSADQQGVTMEVDGESMVFSYDILDKANLVA